jgi:transcriptional regulator with XRE-family HTH domain
MNPNRPNSDGDYVRRVREMLGLNQTEFGQRLGLSDRQIRRYEESDEIPPMAMLAIQKLESDWLKR